MIQITSPVFLYVTRDASDEPYFVWEEMPYWEGVSLGFWLSGGKSIGLSEDQAEIFLGFKLIGGPSSIAKVCRMTQIPLTNKEKGLLMNTWTKHKKKNLQEMRPYIPGEDLMGISVSPQDTPEEGGMIARNPENPLDQWYVAKKFYEENYEPA